MIKSLMKNTLGLLMNLCRRYHLEGAKNTIKRIVKTDVIQVDGGEWKVNNVELVDQ
ncbi:hypothetical protein [Paenibacillus larvae]|uniref:hypothetical protein n=1 Tax=Paenibacillus larvae TaxID=1464 RepID=UPI00288E6311|nr:hypothetical protein [Paenibacillus larvae]MDT2192426.1 hypothetical protein [Paenibacillus larvae]